MTLNDLKEEVSALGFESEIAISKGFLFAVRRALATIYTERGVYKKLSIYQSADRPTLVFKRHTHAAGKTESYELEGAAFSFTVCGSGSFSIEENGIKTVHNFDTPSQAWRGFIDTGAVISFFGELAFEVYDFAVFKEKRFSSEEKIPLYGEPREYQVSQICDDFLSFSELPRDERGEFIKSAELMGDRMRISPYYDGKIRLTYKSNPPKVSLDTPDDEIGIAKEVEHLVPLLSAAYFWLDDDEEKAQYYLSLYRDALNGTKRNATRRLGGGYEDVTGWA